MCPEVKKIEKITNYLTNPLRLKVARKNCELLKLT